METDIRIPSSNPQFPHFDHLGASLYIPHDRTNRRTIAVIVHGHAGHRDYCYQKLLSRTLSIPSIRFDFSGCGTQLGEGTTVGSEALEIPRTLESDDHDLTTVIEYVRARGYFVIALVGHSRGAVCCLNRAKRDHTILTVVNCSGRYRAHLIHEKIRKLVGDDPKEVGYWEKHRAGTGGALVDKYTLLSEIDSVGRQEMQGISRLLSPDVNILIVFGTKDNVVPVRDASLFSNELKERAELQLVDDADHNFFVQATDHRPKVNKNQEVADLIANYLAPAATNRRFLSRHGTLKSPRFMDIEGVTNFRPVGGYANMSSSHIYRSGNLCNITPIGAKTLARSVHTIIDLRSDQEVSLYGTHPGNAIPALSGIRALHIPIFKNVDYSPAGLSKFFNSQNQSRSSSSLNDSEATIDGMLRAYKSILRNCFAVLPALFDALLHPPHLETVRASNTGAADGRGILIHCTAGKDRTGVVCAVLMKLMDVPDEIIALDYELTNASMPSSTVPQSLSISPTESPPTNQSNDRSAPAREKKEKEETVVAPGMSCDAETMRRTVRYLDQEYGGVERYLLRCVNQNTINEVKRLLRVSHRSKL